MDTPRRALESFGLTEDDLIKHWIAHDHLSHTGSEVKLKHIDKETRTKAAKLYKYLRDQGIYPAKPTTEHMRWMIITDYYSGWQKWMQNQKDKPEWQFITLEEVKKLLQESTKEVKKLMTHKLNLWEDHDQAVNTPKHAKQLFDDIPF
jgi:hypothetical protein